MKKTSISVKLYVRRFFLVIYDLIAINLSIFLALFIRFELSLNEQFWHFYGVAIRYSLFISLAGVLIFALFHMYTSLWTYAGVNEMINIFLACIIGSLAQIAIVSFLPPSEDILPRSYYLINPLILFFFEVISRFSYRGIRSYVKKKNAGFAA